MGKVGCTPSSGQCPTGRVFFGFCKSPQINKKTCDSKLLQRQNQTRSAKKCSSGNVKQKSHRTCVQHDHSRVLFENIPGPQAKQQVETSNRSQCVEQILDYANFQNGDSRNHTPIGAKRGVALFNRYKDAYFHVPISHGSQKYLRFQTNEGVFQFIALPFGVATAPFEFTMLAKEVKLLARSQGIRMHVYLDDWLVRADSKEQCYSDSNKLVALVQKLGWQVNFEKSELEPTQTLDFLGYHFDLVQGLVFPTLKKREKFALLAVSIRKSSVVTVRKFMSLIGTLACLEKVVPLGKLHIRPFQWHLKNHWRFPQPLDKKLPLLQRSWLT